MSELILRSTKQRISFRVERKLLVVTPLLLVVMVALCIGSLKFGSYGLSYHQVWLAVTDSQSEQVATTVIWELRLPRFLAALLVGCMLSLSGAILQAVTRNPLADPSLIGISQGASLAVVALIVLWPSAPVELRPLISFAGALIAASAVQWIARGKSSSSSLRFILVGVGISACISACTNAILTYGQINQAAAALSWLAGSVHTASWAACAVLGSGLLLLTPGLIWSIRPATALKLGHEIAIGLGVNYHREKMLIICLAVALAALAVSVTGPIGFIGLIAPQLVQRTLRTRVGGHLLLTALVGGCLVAAADLAGRTIFAPIQLPAGLVTAAIGAPLFLALIISRTQPRQL